MLVRFDANPRQLQFSSSVNESVRIQCRIVEGFAQQFKCGIGFRGMKIDDIRNKVIGGTGLY